MTDAPLATGEVIDRFRALYLEGTIEGVALENRDAEACARCRHLADVYLPWRLPALPVAGCTTAAGCRCRYVAANTVVE